MSHWNDHAKARGGIGRRSGLKIRRAKPHPGSSPGGPIFSSARKPFVKSMREIIGLSQFKSTFSVFDQRFTVFFSR